MIDKPYARSVIVSMLEAFDKGESDNFFDRFLELGEIIRIIAEEEQTEAEQASKEYADADKAIQILNQ